VSAHQWLLILLRSGYLAGDVELGAAGDASTVEPVATTMHLRVASGSRLWTLGSRKIFEIVLQGLLEPRAWSPIALR
jgi:hypothetical protein